MECKHSAADLTTLGEHFISNSGFVHLAVFKGGLLFYDSSQWNTLTPNGITKSLAQPSEQNLLERQADKQTGKQMHADRQTDRQTDADRCRHTDRQTFRQTDRCRQIDRQTD